MSKPFVKQKPFKSKGKQHSLKTAPAARPVGARVEPPTGIDVHAAAQRLLEKAAQVLAVSEPTSTAELVDAFRSAPAQVTGEATRLIAHALRDRSIPILEALATSEDKDLALAAIDALGLTGTEAAGPLLAEIAEKGQSKEIQKAARRSLFRLKSAGVAVPVTVQPEERVATLEAPSITLTKTYMTNPDGEGNQVLWAIAEGPFGRLDVFGLLEQNSYGIKDFDVHDSSKKAWQRELQKINQTKGTTVVEIPMSYYRHRVKRAYEVTRAKGNPVPAELERYRDLLIGAEEPPEEHPVYRDINIVEIKWNPLLLEESTGVLDRNEEFVSWFLPKEDIATYLEELRNLKESKVTLPPWVEKEKLAEITIRALDRFFSTEDRGRYKRCLEDMAYLLFHTNRQIDAKRTLAAALAFDEQTGVPLQKNPFTLALIKRSVDIYLSDLREEAEKHGKEHLLTDLSDLSPYLEHETE